MSSDLFAIASGESFDAEEVQVLSGVSMIRGEYVLRGSGASSTSDVGFVALQTYMEQLAQDFFPKSVWYRLSDFESRELLTVDGYEYVELVENPILSDRGCRRALSMPHEYEAEASAVAEVQSRWPNLHFMLSYLDGPGAFRELDTRSQRKRIARPTGAMIEVPSALDQHRAIRAVGAESLTIGLNDLAMNYLGAHRGTRAHDRRNEGLMRRIADVWRDAPDTTIIANPAGPSHVAEMRRSGAQRFAVQYTELVDYFPSFKMPYAHIVPSIKRKTEGELERLGLNAVLEVR